jgi:acetyl esterase
VSEIQSLGSSGGRELTAQIVRPVAAGASPDCVMLYFHGGSFTEGCANDAANQCTRVADAVGMPVVMLNYALAPEHPFPAAIEDGLHALDWLGSGAPRASGLRVREVVLAGIEAGGNIAASVALLALDRPCAIASRRRPTVRAQILICPLLDPCMTISVPTSACSKGWRAYLPRLADRTHPYASPLNSSRLAGLPPALIITDNQDQSRAEAERYSAKLIAAGVPVQAVRFSAAVDDPVAAEGATRRSAARFSADTLAAMSNFLAAPARAA